jgi:hypothetical protein
MGSGLMMTIVVGQEVATDDRSRLIPEIFVDDVNLTFDNLLYPP